MKRAPGEVDTSILPLTISEFLESYNRTLPAEFPQASLGLLQKFKSEHTALFTRGDTWTLDRHRKKVIEWLPRNSVLS